jgi:3-methyladenine DNA glycosylase AlkD
MNVEKIQSKLQELGDGDRAQVLQGFFKTGPGEYGEGDVFLGIRVSELRKLAKENQSLTLSETLELLQASIHEARLLALFILVRAYARADDALQEQIYEIYLQNTRFVNSWDLVDSSAEYIVGAHLLHRDRSRLLTLASSEMIWDRRIAIMATFHYIKQGEIFETLRVAGMLLNDAEDLIHKAVGWMLREVGKRNHAAEQAFLTKHYRSMPRTMLRYAIERFPEDLRQRYLQGDI